MNNYYSQKDREKRLKQSSFLRQCVELLFLLLFFTQSLSLLNASKKRTYGDYNDVLTSSSKRQKQVESISFLSSFPSGTPITEKMVSDYAPENIPFTKDDLSRVNLDWNFLAQPFCNPQFTNKKGETVVILQRYAYKLEENALFNAGFIKENKEFFGSAHRAFLFFKRQPLGYKPFFPDYFKQEELFKLLTYAVSRVDTIRYDVNTHHWHFHADLTEKYDFDATIVLEWIEQGLRIVDIYPSFRYNLPQEANNIAKITKESDLIEFHEKRSQRNRLTYDDLDPEPFKWRAHCINKHLMHKPRTFSKDILEKVPALRGKRISLNGFHLLYPGLTIKVNSITDINGGHHDYGYMLLQNGFYNLGTNPSEGIRKLNPDGSALVYQYMGGHLLNNYGKSLFPTDWTYLYLVDVIVNSLHNFTMHQIAGKNSQQKPPIEFIKDKKTNQNTDRVKIFIGRSTIKKLVNQPIYFDCIVIVDTTSGFIVTTYPIIKPAKGTSNAQAEPYDLSQILYTPTSQLIQTTTSFPSTTSLKMPSTTQTTIPPSSATKKDTPVHNDIKLSLQQLKNRLSGLQKKLTQLRDKMRILAQFLLSHKR